MKFAGYVMALSIVVPTGETISVTSNSGGPTSVTLTPGTYSIVTFCAMLQTVLTSTRPVSGGAWSVSVSRTGTGATGKVTIAVSAGTFAITWTSTSARDLLGFTGSVSAAASSTGAAQAKGLWFPDCSLVSDVDLKRAPINSSRRVAMAPTGATSSAQGVTSYRHTSLQWGEVSLERVWTAEETTTNASYETFAKDALFGLGHGWFEYDGRVAIFDHREVAAGADASISGWQVAQLPELHTLRMKVAGWTGRLVIVWPLITSDG